MDEKWEILLYETLQGAKPVRDFILNLDSKAQLKIQDAMELLEELGVVLGLPHIKKLTGTELWELRILGGDSIRILYISITGRRFLFLHGFKKKKDKTPLKEIKIAERRLADFRSR